MCFKHNLISGYGASPLSSKVSIRRSQTQKRVIKCIKHNTLSDSFMSQALTNSELSSLYGASPPSSKVSNLSFCLIIFLKKGLFECACFGGCSSKSSPPSYHITYQRLTISLVKILVYKRKIAVESEIQAVWDGRGEIVELRAAVQKSPKPNCTTTC